MKMVTTLHIMIDTRLYGQVATLFPYNRFTEIRVGKGTSDSEVTYTNIQRNDNS